MAQTAPIPEAELLLLSGRCWWNIGLYNGNAVLCLLHEDSEGGSSVNGIKGL